MSQPIPISPKLDANAVWQLLDAAPDAIVVVDRDGRMVLVNLQAEHMFGYAREELLGQEVELLIPGRFRGSHSDHRKRFAGTPQARPMGSGMELYALRRDGSEFPVEISLSPVSTAIGAFVAASVRDISDRKRLQAKAEQLRQYLLSALDSIEGSFFIWDKSDRLVVCNSTARALWGSALDGELVGKTWQELVDVNLHASIIETNDDTKQRFLERITSYHAAPEGDFSFNAPGGRSLRLVERRTSEGGIVGLITDVTDAVEHEEALRRAREVAEAANAAKSEFLSSMSHELRTPLNAVLGFAQLLQRDKQTPLTAKQQQRIGHVLKGSEHLLHLIDDVLDLARIEAGRITVSVEPVDVSEVLDEVETTMAPMAMQAHIKLIISKLPGGLSKVLADRIRLKQILMNFTSNAIKYGRAGGHVILEGSIVETGDIANGRLRLCVDDDGIGIPESKQSKIFEPFQRAGQEAGPIEGTGIGLTISKRLAERMGATVDFESSEGNGSKFWIDLPFHSEAQPVLATEGPEERGESVLASAASGPVHRIIYIEDNPSNIQLMEDLLGDFERIELLTAPNAEIGIELVRARTPKVVIMDINLPGMSGIEARRRLKEWPETRDIPVVALSAAAMLGEARRIEEADFHRYLKKPVDIDELTSVLEELLA